MSTDPTLLGYVAAVSGSSITVRLMASVESGLSIIEGVTYRIGQVGSFVRVPLGYQDLFGIVGSVGASAVPEAAKYEEGDTGRWMSVELVGESIGGAFERGISQYPNVGDAVHLVTLANLSEIYGTLGFGQVPIGRLSSAESLEVRVDLDKLVGRHSAVLGSTGSGKSTTVASLLRSICQSRSGPSYPNARILVLDVHGEYSQALHDIGTVFRINAREGEHELHVPYWALDAEELTDFLTGGIADDKALHIYDKITELRTRSVEQYDYPGTTTHSLTVDTPVPFSLKQLWYELIDPELKTLEGPQRDTPAIIDVGDPDALVPPKYKPHAMGSAGPFINTAAPGIRRQLNTLRSRLLDRQYDFLLHPGPWEPSLDGLVDNDLPDLLRLWLGQERPISVLDLSGVPSNVLVRLIGSILKVTFDALFWGRSLEAGGEKRPLLVVMEEAHRYLGSGSNNAARDMVQRIVKEGRKYGVGAMVISQRPSEVDETVLSQCGTFFSLRLSNPTDRSRVQGTLPDHLAGLVDELPVLRTGETIVTGEGARLPIRCRVTLPKQGHRPDSHDPAVSLRWSTSRTAAEENYDQLVAGWRAKNAPSSEE